MIRSRGKSRRNDGRAGLFAFFLGAQLTHAALAEAEAAWDQELRAFPVR